MKSNIVFFDGVCNLCNWSVDFILKHDKKEHFSFASLQGETAKQYVLTELSSVIYINESGEVFDKSDAVIEIAPHLFAFGKVLFVFKFIPKFIRDGFYNWIAKNRYKLFGKKDSCRLPSIEEKNRFLN